MMSSGLLAVSYIGASILFILSLGGLSHQAADGDRRDQDAIAGDVSGQRRRDDCDHHPGDAVKISPARGFLMA